MPKRLVQSAGLAVCFTLAACALPRGARYTLHVTVAPDANEHTPVPVDLVFVWDKEEAGKVAALTAAEWFASKVQSTQDTHKLTVCQWEWVPGQVVPDINLAIPPAARRWARGVFLFAHYRSEGPHGSRVTEGTAVRLDLGRDDLRLIPIGRTLSSQYTLLDQAQACRAISQP
jgi:type VI secretion system protein